MNEEPSLFLRRTDVEQLTGYKQKSAQCDWLKRNGVHFHVDKLGYPVVMRESLIADRRSRSRRTASDTPDLEALRT